MKIMKILFKYTLDFIASLILIVLLSPILLLISFFIKYEDRESIFFTQLRNGVNGSKFFIIKFRTMIINADSYLDESGKPTIDRITRIGRILRWSSLDELPQLFNIIIGDMSFIGPRPTLISHWDRYTDEQKKRSRMRPGITGWAQVCGRNEIPWSDRIKLDIEYIENFSFWFDVVIFYKTIGVIFTRRGLVLDRNTSSVDDLNE